MKYLISIAVLVVGCANDPVYLPGPMSLEAGTGTITEISAQHVLPIKLETTEDAALRAMRTAALAIDVPYVKVGDLEVSVEWTIRNLDLMNEGLAFVNLNGANEVMAYDPMMVALGDPEEEPPAPPLAGDRPIHVPAGGTLSGLFREDQLVEASIDLDLITRANLNPFAATLQTHRDADEFQPMTAPMPGVDDYMQTPVGAPIPREAFRQMIRIDLVFKPDRHMVLDYAIRVRDTRGIMHELLDAAVTAVPGELTMFAPTDYAVMYTP